MPTSSEKGGLLSNELQKNAVDVLGLGVKGALGSTAVGGSYNYVNPSTIGLSITIVSFLVFLVLSWKKNKIYDLQVDELERHRAKDLKGND